MIYHFGNIYDDSMNMAYMVQPSTNLDTSGYNQIGQLVGNIFTETFYNFNDFSYPDPVIVYPSE